MAIFDTMQVVEAEVQPVCVGLTASMRYLLLVGGEIIKRVSFPHAWCQWFLFVENKKDYAYTNIN